jgi:ABC-type oligopeptide transport system ATPase subunit
MTTTVPGTDTDVVARVTDLNVHFPAGSGKVVHAVDGVSLDVRRG